MTSRPHQTRTYADATLDDPSVEDGHEPLDGLVLDLPQERLRRRGWLVRRALAAADVVGLTAAFLLAELLYAWNGGTADRVDPAVETIAFAITLPGWIVLASLFGLYSRAEERADHSTVDDLSRVFTVITIGSWLFVAATWAVDVADPYIPKLTTFWAGAIVLVTGARVTARALVRRRKAYLQNTLILGAGDVGQLIASKVLRHPEYGINLLGFLDGEPKQRRDDLGDLTVLGEPAQLLPLVRKLDVERVIVAFSRDSREAVADDLHALRDMDVQVDVAPRFFDLVGPGATFHAVEGLPLIAIPPTQLSPSALVLKRALDVVGSAIGLVLLSPVFAVIAIRIKLGSPGPVFFRQERPGVGGRRFRVVKFRTMHVTGPDDPAAPPLRETRLNDEYRRRFKLANDPRVTPIGRWLRRTSIDELPQLWNVLRGEMSLVGPRPMLIEELEGRWHDPSLRRTLRVKPGITGYWQINGRSDLDYDDRVRLELSYVANWSLGLDLTIMMRTIQVLFSARGAV